jgi:hypothetical protein
VAGHTPWAKIRHKAEQDWWTELRFHHRARDRDAAGEAVERLLEEADHLGFTLELGHTGPERPEGDLSPPAPKRDTG